MISKLYKAIRSQRWDHENNKGSVIFVVFLLVTGVLTGCVADRSLNPTLLRASALDAQWSGLRALVVSHREGHREDVAPSHQTVSPQRTQRDQDVPARSHDRAVMPLVSSEASDGFYDWRSELVGLDPLVLFYVVGSPTRIVIDGANELWQVRRSWGDKGCWVRILLTPQSQAAAVGTLASPQQTTPTLQHSSHNNHVVGHVDVDIKGRLPYGNDREYCSP